MPNKSVSVWVEPIGHSSQEKKSATGNYIRKSRVGVFPRKQTANTAFSSKMEGSLKQNSAPGPRNWILYMSMSEWWQESFYFINPMALWPLISGEIGGRRGWTSLVWRGIWVKEKQRMSPWDFDPGQIGHITDLKKHPLKFNILKKPFTGSLLGCLYIGNGLMVWNLRAFRPTGQPYPEFEFARQELDEDGLFDGELVEAQPLSCNLVTLHGLSPNAWHFLKSHVEVDMFL